MITARESDGSFATLIDARAEIADLLGEHSRQMVRQTGGLLAETSAYLLSSPGKLLRPLLMLDACRAAGGDPDVVFPAAAGTEYGHIASLVHDDIIDGDHERRGQQTLHVKYNLGAALLTGDLLIFETFLSYTQCHERGAGAERVLAAIRTLSETCIDVCRGQALEAVIAGDLTVNEPTYLEMIRLKTASVCMAATRIGAILSGAPDDVIAALSEFGYALGMAFQIIDDVLAYEGQSTIVGKPLHSDLLNRRVTLPIIYALQDGEAYSAARIEELFTTPIADDGEAAHAHLAHILRESHAVERARTLAYHYTALAQHNLDVLPYTEARERLRSLADVFMARDH